MSSHEVGTVPQPLLARGRYIDEEWEYASSGRCDQPVEVGMHLRIVRCGEPSSPDSFYRRAPSTTRKRDGTTRTRTASREVHDDL